MVKKQKIVLVRSPQPYLITDEGELYSPNRLLSPEPTLPLLEGIIRKVGVDNGLDIEVAQLDLRDSQNGLISHEHFGDVNLSYIPRTLRKMCSGVPIESQKALLEDADVIGFTNNFTMARNVVRSNIEKVRKMFPEKEIWIGGRDVFPEKISEIYAESTGKRNTVIFDGHVFSSLPEYLKYRAGMSANLQGISLFDNNGRKTRLPTIPLTKISEDRKLNMPLPVYTNPNVLDRFNYSGEGPIGEGHGRFVHMTLGIGCPHKCGYCTTGWRERYLVSRDLDSIGKELDYYKLLGVKTLAIMDDNLLSLGSEKVNAMMSLINFYGFNVEYGNGLELRLLHGEWDKVADNVLKNCTTLYAPLEDLTGDVSYKKLETRDQQIELMKSVVDYFDRRSAERPRYVTMGVILGVPGHTRKGLFRNLPQNAEKFLELFVGKKVNTAITAFNYMPLAGTSFGDEAINGGRMITDVVREHPEIVNFELTTYAPEGLTHQDVFEAYKRTINLNPAGRLDPRGNRLGSTYEMIKRFGERVLPVGERDKIPSYWRELGKDYTGGRVAGAGLHYKAPMTEQIAKENIRGLNE